MDWKIKLFVALGGVGFVLGIIAKGVKPAVKKAVQWGISKDHPSVRQFVLDQRRRFRGRDGRGRGASTNKG